MTKEEKQLLIKDLAARLPYNVVVGCTEDDEPDTFFKCVLTGEMLQTVIYGTEYYNYIPFLRPMSSMTEEEKNELKSISEEYLDEWIESEDKWKTNALSISKQAIFYNSHYLDWMGLIEKCLAYEVTDENNPY